MFRKRKKPQEELPERVDVTIKMRVPYVAGYQRVLNEMVSEYIVWIAENIGEYVTWIQSYDMSTTIVTYRFTFYTEDDAAAFKLRWI